MGNKTATMPSIVIQKGDPDFTKKTAIVAVVDRYRALHPDEWAVFVEGQKAAKAGLYNENGMDKSGIAAMTARIPEKLLDMLDMITEGDGLRIEKDEKLWKWFKESFPVFMISNKRTTKKFL